jgi:hypothetical protein
MDGKLSRISNSQQKFISMYFCVLFKHWNLFSTHELSITRIYFLFMLNYQVLPTLGKLSGQSGGKIRPLRKNPAPY